MEDCIFCKIGKGEIKSEFLYEDEDFFIIKDIHPAARIHYLAIPKAHYARLEGAQDDMEAIKKIFKKIAKIKDDLGLSEGYRIIINQGKNARQDVQHVHVHILGGQDLGSKLVKEDGTCPHNN